MNLGLVLDLGMYLGIGLDLGTYLVSTAQDGSLAGQPQADGTNDAGLACSISSNNHVEIGPWVNLCQVICAAGKGTNPVTIYIHTHTAAQKEKLTSLVKLADLKYLHTHTNSTA